MASPSTLPVRKQKSRIVDKVQLNRVTLIVAETGSGKSTQVPQMLLEEGFGPILCTQPRRLAVVAISKLVAKERGCELGEEVGFHIGQKKLISSRCKIVFETTGVLLEELRCEGPKVLSRFKVIIFDEVHERSIESDLALACIKLFMMRNANIRLVLMSATYDYDLYQQYFKDLDRGERVEVIPISSTAAELESVQFKCETHYLEKVKTLLDTDKIDDCESVDKAEDLNQYIQNMITQLVVHIHKKEDDWKKNILIFLPTYKTLEHQWSLLKRRGLEIKLFVLHSSVDLDHSVKAMEIMVPVRKVILATNVAESSVTIPGISYVIDACRSLQIYWDNERKKSLPRLVWVSKSQADQRKGRTGRTCDGEVFRMVPSSVFNSFRKYEQPAIQLLSLREQVLAISCSDSKAINDPRVFFSKSMDPPNEQTIENALQILRSIDALNPSQQRGKYVPTVYGKLLACLPLSLASAILVIKGGQLGFLRESAILSAMMDSSPLPILRPFGCDDKYQMYLEKYYKKDASSHSDTTYVSVLLANLHAFEFWQCTFKDRQRLEKLLGYVAQLKCGESNGFYLPEVGEEAWCAEHHLSLSALQTIAETSSSIIEKMHIFRPKFLNQVQGPPGYYSSYEFQHVCDVRNDEEKCLDSVILLDDESNVDSEICLTEEFVRVGEFHESRDLALLRNLVGQVQKDLFQETEPVEDSQEEEEEDEEDSVTETVPLCRYYQRGMCNRGSLCPFTHDLAVKPMVCKYFMTERGCRYGEMCQFRHSGSTRLPSMTEPITEFDEDPPTVENFLKLLPPSYEESILIYGENDLSFTWKLSQYYSAEKIVVLTSSAEESVTGSVTRTKVMKDELGNHGTKIIWNMDMWPVLTQDDQPISWIEIACVLWTIKREDDEVLIKRLSKFFSSLSLTLISQGLADTTLILTMYCDQYSRCQVERVARDNFFFLTQSFLFDNSTFRIFKRIEEPAFGDPKPVTYVFELIPPSAFLHGEYFWHLQQALQSSSNPV